MVPYLTFKFTCISLRQSFFLFILYYTYATSWTLRKAALVIPKKGLSVNGRFCLDSSLLLPWTSITIIVSRLNTKLEANGYPPMTSLVKDLSDGVRLIQLMVCSSISIEVLEEPIQTMIYADRR